MALTAKQVQELYLGYYGRPADPVGLAYWQTQTLEAAMAGFAASAEFTNQYAGMTVEQQVNQVYVNLLGRPSDLAGLLYWSGEIVSGRETIGTLVMSMQRDALGRDVTTLQMRADFAEAFTNALDTTDEVLDYSGQTAAAAAREAMADIVAASTGDTSTLTTALANLDSTVAGVVAGGGMAGQTYMLTTGIDSVPGTSGNDTINAALDAGAMTFSSLDAIDGGAGIDTLNLVATGSLAGAAGATVKNVEIVNLTSAAAITAANVSGFTGLETLNVASGGNIAGVVAAATTDINVLNGLDGVAVDGGKNVVVNNSTAGNINVGATTAAAGNVTATNSFATGTVTLKGAGALSATSNDGAITLVNGTSATAIASQAVDAAVRAANLAAQTAADDANAAATGDTDASGEAKLAAAQKVTDLAQLATDIAAATNSVIGAADSIQAATKTALDAGAITVAEKIAIDTAFAGAATVAAGKTAAQAVLTPLQTAATAASNAAAAADVINDAQAAAAKAAADAVVAADAAKNALVDGVTVTATTNTTLQSASIKGNYGSTGLGTGAAFGNVVTDASTLSNVLTTVTLENTGAAELTGKALTNVSAKGMSANVTVVNTTLDHTQNFTFEAVTGGTYTDANAKTVNIVSNGSATNVLTGLSATLATAVNLTGAAGLTFGTTTLAANAVIDATGSSGTNTISVAAGQKYTGGSGADVVTAGNALQTADVDGGAGSADKLILTNDAAFATTGAAKFKNFEVLQANTGTTVDVTKFTGSTFTSVVLSGDVTISGLNATQAAAISILGGTQVLDIGVAGATTVGQLDTVTITNNTAAATLASPTLAGVETLNLVAGKDLTIGVLTNATALTNVNVTGAGDVSITSDALALNVNSVVDASAATGDVTLDFALATANGISLKGGDGDNTLTGTDIAGKGNLITSGNGDNTIVGGQANDVITVGNGNNTITAGAGNDTITAGNGNNTIGAASGNNTITVGNGWNVITTGAGADTITVGTGANVITAGAGADVITLGASVAGTGNKIVIGDADSGITVATADKITGFTTGADKLALGVAGTAANYAEASVAVADFAAALAAVNGGILDTTVQFAFQFDGTNGYLFEDNDLDGAADSVIVLVGATNASIAFADIIA